MTNPDELIESMPGTINGRFVPQIPSVEVVDSFPLPEKLEPPHFFDQLAEEMKVNPFEESVRVHEHYQDYEQDLLDEHKTHMDQIYKQADELKEDIASAVIHEDE